MDKKVQFIGSTGALLSSALEDYQNGRVKDIVLIQVTTDNQIILNSSDGIIPIEGIGLLEMCKQVLLTHAFNE